MQDIYKEMQSLTDDIHRHNKLYYVDNSPVISDTEYDKLLSRLISLEKKYPDLVDASSPTKRIGDLPLEFFPTFEHLFPMLSLANTYSAKELNSFFKRIEKLLKKSLVEYVLEPKIDGVSISLIYKEGRLDKALTRGDGKVGSVVSANIKTIKSIPLVLKEKIDIEVRGEIFFPKEAFRLFNEEQSQNEGKVFANARNAAAGSLKLLDPRKLENRPLDNFIYSIIAPSTSVLFPSSHFKRLSYLSELGFKVNPKRKLSASKDEIIEYLKDMEKLKSSLDYDTDGMVIKLNSIKDQEELGNTFKAPRWAVAYKFSTERKTSRVKEIELSVGPSGAITPIALLEPVKITNTIVSKASLHNFSELIKKDVRVLDEVIVEKSGEIIPNIVSVIKKSRDSISKPFIIPSLCPSCSTVLEDDISLSLSCQNSKCRNTKIEIKHISKSAIGSYNFSSILPKYLNDFLTKRECEFKSIPCPFCKEALGYNINLHVRCKNVYCNKKLLRRISKFAAKDAMDIAGLGPQVVSSLIESNLIRDYADLYYLEEKDLLSLEGFASKSSYELIKAINKSKKMPFHALINALSIPNIGQKQAYLLASKLTCLKELSTADIIALEEIVGTKAASNIVHFFKEENNQIAIGKLSKASVSFVDIPSS